MDRLRYKWPKSKLIRAIIQSQQLLFVLDFDVQYLVSKMAKLEFTIGHIWITTLAFPSFTSCSFTQVRLNHSVSHQTWASSFHRVMMELRLHSTFNWLEKASSLWNYLNTYYRSKMINRSYSDERCVIRDFKIISVQNMYLIGMIRVKRL